MNTPCLARLALFLGLVLLGLATQARAVESLIVTTTVDENNGTSDPAFGTGTSLREAIDWANSDGLNSAITFDPTAFALPRKTITLGGTCRRRLRPSGNRRLIALRAASSLARRSGRLPPAAQHRRSRCALAAARRRVRARVPFALPSAQFHPAGGTFRGLSRTVSAVARAFQ